MPRYNNVPGFSRCFKRHLSAVSPQNLSVMLLICFYLSAPKQNSPRDFLINHTRSCSVETAEQLDNLMAPRRTIGINLNADEPRLFIDSLYAEFRAVAIYMRANLFLPTIRSANLTNRFAETLFARGKFAAGSRGRKREKERRKRKNRAKLLSARTAR